MSETRTISVPAEGLAEKFVIEGLGITSAELYPLYSDVLRSPRDYRYLHGTSCLNHAGVTRLVKHLGLEVVVLKDGEQLSEAHTTPAQIAHPQRHRGPWWQKDLSED